jgi:ABC-2 type transport system permease protein
MIMKTFFNNFYISWAIASRDIVDALRNKSTRTNIILMMGMVVFFFWASTVRPWDKSIEVAVYDEADSGLFEGTIALSDGYEIRFIDVSSQEQMQRNMRFEHWGLVVPVDFEETLDLDNEPVLSAYVLWRFRGEVAELETLYSSKFSELFDRPVRIEIGDNIIVPDPNIETTSVNAHILFATFFMAISFVPFLMMEEKQAKTMDALLVSPASAGQVVLGKALAGSFYVLLAGGLFFALNWIYITNWWLALLAFFCSALFSIGLALLAGSYVNSQQQMSFWMLPLIFVLIIPAFFSQEPNLAAGLKAVIDWIPTSAIVEIFQFAISNSAPMNQLLVDIAVSLGSTALIFAILAWKVRRSDR